MSQLSIEIEELNRVLEGNDAPDVIKCQMSNVKCQQRIYHLERSCEQLQVDWARLILKQAPQIHT